MSLRSRRKNLAQGQAKLNAVKVSAALGIGQKKSLRARFSGRQSNRSFAR
jgi:hypothetical protein